MLALIPMQQPLAVLLIPPDMEQCMPLVCRMCSRRHPRTAAQQRYRIAAHHMDFSTPKPPNLASRRSPPGPTRCPRAAATSSTPTTSSGSTAPTACGCTRCSWARCGTPRSGLGTFLALGRAADCATTCGGGGHLGWGPGGTGWGADAYCYTAGPAAAAQQGTGCTANWSVCLPNVSPACVPAGVVHKHGGLHCTVPPKLPCLLRPVCPVPGGRCGPRRAWRGCTASWPACTAWSPISR